MNIEIEKYEDKIASIDEEIMEKLRERVDLAAKAAVAKSAKGLPISNPVSERKRMDDLIDMMPEGMESYAKLLFSTVTELSKDYERKATIENTPLATKIVEARESTKKVFPERAIVACQGVQGAYQQQAADKMFHMPKIVYMKNFNGVFQAIDQGLCQYGVLPLENSTAGSVNTVYELMSRYNFYIVRSVRLKIDHCLLAKKGTKLDDIKEIYSHEQALLQCEDFLKNFSDVKVVTCANTAAAAEAVAGSERNDIAAIASHECTGLYGLECLEESVQDTQNNYTRFICISKNLEIYPGANKCSLMMTIPHKPGSLYNVLARFYALDINLIKLESRPIPTRDFVYRFYFDIEADAFSDKFIRLMNQVDEISEDIRYLGSYSEII